MKKKLIKSKQHRKFLRKFLDKKTKLLTKLVLISFLSLFCLITNAQITNVEIEDIGSQTNVPITFGQPFKKGDIPSGSTLVAKNSAGNSVEIQVDKKATFSDGSLRHGIISSILSNSTDSELNLFVQSGEGISSSETTTTLVNTGLSVKVNLTISGTIYTANLSGNALNSPTSTWLSGAVMNEWEYLIPFTKSSGQEHQHLVAHINLRKYIGMDNVRVDVSVENGFTFVPNPGNITYNTQIKINNQVVYTKSNLTHFHRSRWRKIFWSTNNSNLHLKHNTDYLIKTKAVSNYNQSLVFTDANIQVNYNKWQSSPHGPMDINTLAPKMGAGGGRPEIGPLPEWDVRYLLTMDRRDKEVMLSMGDLSGSWSVFYKDKNTNKPISIETYTEVTTRPQNRYNEPNALPQCNDCDELESVRKSDNAHQPGFAYLPYLITGDKYYLESLQYWANMNFLYSPVDWRDFGDGTYMRLQTRGQAWSMRTLGRAFAFTPESDSMKAYFKRKLDYNFSVYQNHLINDVNNKLGIVTTGYVFAYDKRHIGQPDDGGRFKGVASWQEAFFTWSINHLVELDITEAQPLFAWKTKFIHGMMTNPDYCWQMTPHYGIIVRDTNPLNKSYEFAATDSPIDHRLYQTFEEVYEATVPSIVATKTCGTQSMVDAYASLSLPSQHELRDKSDMIGDYGNQSPISFIANTRPALAAVVDYVGGAEGAEIWNKFESRIHYGHYEQNPVWAISPRGETSDGENTVDEIITFNPPSQVIQGQSLTITVDYEAAGDRSVVLQLKNSESTYFPIHESKLVSPGNGTTTFNVQVPTDVPVGTAYQFITFITTSLTEPWIEHQDYESHPVTVLESTGQENSIELYPNPTSEKVTLELPVTLNGWEYQLVTISGQVIKKGTFKNATSTLDLKALTNGIYFLQLTSDQKTEIHRIVKK